MLSCSSLLIGVPFLCSSVGSLLLIFCHPTLRTVWGPCFLSCEVWCTSAVAIRCALFCLFCYLLAVACWASSPALRSRAIASHLACCAQLAPAFAPTLYLFGAVSLAQLKLLVSGPSSMLSLRLLFDSLDIVLPPVVPVSFVHTETLPVPALSTVFHRCVAGPS